MTLNAPGYRIIGASFLGPKPIGCSHIDVSSGSTMFYGKNGVGKTRLLDQVTQAFQGIGRSPGLNRPQTLIHIEVDVRSQKGDNAFMLELYEMLDIPREVSREDDDRAELQTAVLERINDETEQDLEDPLALLDYPELRTSIGLSFSLAPSGTPESPSWSVYSSATLDNRERHDLTNYGTALSRITRSMLENSPFDDGLMTASSPLRLAQATEWYKEPFEFVKGQTPVESKYLQLGVSPLASWPAHLPVPLVKIGSITRGPAQAFANSMPLKDIQQSTLSLVAASARGKGHLVEGTDGADVMLSAAADEAVLKAETETNRILNILADFPFTVRFNTGTPSDWFAGKTPQWTATQNFGDQSKIPLSDLSFSQQKWVRFALSLYLAKSDVRMPRVVIVDEPEQGLHRQLESRISEGLHKLTSEFPGVAIIGATHSPAFLDPRHGGSLRHMTLTGSGVTLISPLEVGFGRFNIGEEADRLGVRPSDILTMTRVAVIVEGVHDQIVLEKSLSRDLREAGAKIFAMRGTDNAAALPDMQFLFDALDAPILVVVDNVAQSRIQPIWARAKVAVRANDIKLAQHILQELSKDAESKEERALSELGIRALQIGRFPRIVPFGLKRPDILDYLEPSHFNLDENDWKPYKDEWWSTRTFQNGKQIFSDSFKDFLRKKHNAKINNRSVEQASLALTALPDDFVDLGNQIRTLGYLGVPDDLELTIR